MADRHWHYVQRVCTDPYCKSTMPDDGMIPWGPINGMNHIAADLIRHFEIDPAEHDGLALEIEHLIGGEMLTIAREVFAERGIVIPAEVDALPAQAPDFAAKGRARRDRTMPPCAVGWDDLSVGQVIDFRHHNRSQRLAGRAPAVRRGRIDLIWYPRDREAKKQLPQIRLRLMNRNGVIRYGRAGEHALYDERAIEDVVRVVKGRRQCVKCARSGGELSENGCPSCGPDAEIRWVPEEVGSRG